MYEGVNVVKWGSNGVKNPSRSTGKDRVGQPSRYNMRVMTTHSISSPLKRNVWSCIKHKHKNFDFLFFATYWSKTKPIPFLFSQPSMNNHRNVHTCPGNAIKTHRPPPPSRESAILRHRLVVPKPKKHPPSPDFNFSTPSSHISASFSQNRSRKA